MPAIDPSASEADRLPRHMKWWGWGDEGESFDAATRPGLLPYMRRVFGIEGEFPRTLPVAFDRIRLPEQRPHPAFLQQLRRSLPDEYIRDSKHERLVHSAGKSFRELWSVRHGRVEAAPDYVLYPQNAEQVSAVVRACHRHDVTLIPFGGGSNIAGCLSPQTTSSRTVVSLDMGCMNRVLEVDRTALTARIQAGVYGPHLERQLAAHGLTLGHFPDSFLHSTLGGWLATRSAGMQSDLYGKIEDMLISLRMITPVGELHTRTVPKASNGIDMRALCAGSEGTLGVITEATVQVHPMPAHKHYYGYLFPSFDSGITAIRQCVRTATMPVICRLNDVNKTALSFAFKQRGSRLQECAAAAFKAGLKRLRRVDFASCCLLIAAYEGDAAQLRRQRRAVERIYRAAGGIALGTAPGRGFERAKFDFPHLRDYTMDRNIMADVSETATTWSNLPTLYRSTRDAIDAAITATGSNPWTGCHISHNYHTGASLYFTFACLQQPGRELAQYLYIKQAAEDAFLAGGATLSHHHAVGTEHLPWMQQDISATGVRALQALKHGLDPAGVMNPGKLIPDAHALDHWGLADADRRAFDQRRRPPGAA